MKRKKQLREIDWNEFGQSSFFETVIELLEKRREGLNIKIYNLKISKDARELLVTRWDEIGQIIAQLIEKGKQRRKK